MKVKIEDFNYYISEEGVVVNADTGNIVKQRVNNRGYWVVNLYKDKKSAPKTIHRLLAKAFIPNPLDLPCINHIDGNKLNNSLSNIEWCTQKHNVQHAYKLGLSKSENKGKKGSLNAAAILSDNEVHFICKLISENTSSKHIRLIVPNLSRGMLYNIRTLKCWTHISENYQFPKRKKYER